MVSSTYCVFTPVNHLICVHKLLTVHHLTVIFSAVFVKMATGGRVTALRFEFEGVRDTGREVIAMVKQLNAPPMYRAVSWCVPV